LNKIQTIIIETIHVM